MKIKVVFERLKTGIIENVGALLFRMGKFDSIKPGMRLSRRDPFETAGNHFLGGGLAMPLCRIDGGIFLSHETGLFQEA